MKNTLNLSLKITLLVILSVSGRLFAQNYTWAKSVGSINADFGNGIAVDSSSGSVYTTGSLSHFMGNIDSADFDPSSGTAYQYLGSAELSAIFIAKYDANGNYLWAKSCGSLSLYNTGNGIAVDANGNVYVIGTFTDTIDFDFGAGTANLITADNGTDIFIAKYDANGNYLWAHNIGNVGSDAGYGIVIDPSGGGNIYLTGDIFSDIFIAKYDTNGNNIWTKTVGGTSQDVAKSITADIMGNVYITGYTFGDTLDFDPSSGIANISAPFPNSNEIFFAKYDANGNYIWAQIIGGATEDHGTSITVDKTGNVYITGDYQMTVDFDPGIGTSSMMAIDVYDVFFAKYDSNGNYLWAKSIGSPGMDAGNGIAIDDGGIYITGCFQGSTDFDPNAGTTNLNSIGYVDIFFAKYDLNGNYVWAKNVGSGDDDRGNGITTDNNGNVYVIGHFSFSADFDPGTGTAYLNSVGTYDVFFAKYAQATTGVQENNTLSLINIFPNPASTELNVNITNEWNINVINIYDTQGRLLQTEKVANNTTLQKVNISTLINGLYILELKQENTIINRNKFQKK